MTTPEFELADPASACVARGEWTLAHAGVLAAGMADAVARRPEAGQA